MGKDQLLFSLYSSSLLYGSSGILNRFIVIRLVTPLSIPRQQVHTPFIYLQKHILNCSINLSPKNVINKPPLGDEKEKLTT